MRVHILGRGGGCPGPGGSGPGFLVETPNTRILLDCGSGVAGRLLTVCPLDALDAIILTHLNPDHILDVVTLAYGLLSRAQTTDPTIEPKRIPLYLPRGETATLTAISTAFGHSGWLLRDVPTASPAYHALSADIASRRDVITALLPPLEYDLDSDFAIADCIITTSPMRHGVPTAALRLTTAGSTLVYSADTGPTPALAEIAQSADLFICEAMATNSGPLFYDGHLTPTQAGAAAQAANVRELVLTHLPPFADEPSAVAEAQREYTGPIRIAHEGDVFAVHIGAHSRAPF